MSEDEIRTDVEETVTEAVTEEAEYETDTMTEEDFESDDDSIFENRFEYTEGLLKELYKGMLKWDKRRKVNSIIIYVLLTANIIMNIIFIALGNHGLITLLILSLILLGIVLGFRFIEPIILSKSVTSSYRKQYGKNMDVFITFSEDYMTMHDISVGTTHQESLPYSRITSIHESENFVVLKMDKRQTMNVYKKGFTKGTLDEFRVFIFDKMKELEQ